MSETDDTDALITCDPGGGLENFLEKTMDNIPSQTDSTNSTSLDKTNSIHDTRASTSSLEGTEANLKNHPPESKDKSLNISDFFNSEGELVLSGVSQLSGPSDSDSNEEKESSASDLENVNDSSDGTLSTVESNTVVDANAIPSVTQLGVSEIPCSDIKRMNNKVRSPKGNVSRSGDSIVHRNSELVPKDIQDDLKRQILNANRSHPAVQDWLENGQNQLTYGVLNLNLNDLKSFAEGLSRQPLFPSQSQKVSTFVPTKNDKGEKIFTRAPNFRTPGGYKPSKNSKPCRNLTDEQIRDEVRRMYAFPYVDEEGDFNASSPHQHDKCLKGDNETKCDKAITDVVHMNKNSEISEKLNKQFDFLHGKPGPTQFGKGKSGKSIKRKLLPNGGGICGGTIGSIPDLGFGVRNASSEEIEAPVERSTAYKLGNSGQDKQNNQIRDNISNPGNGEMKQSSGFSFGYGEEESMLSPIKPNFTQSSAGCQINPNLLQSKPLQQSPSKPDENTDSAINVTPSNLEKQLECLESNVMRSSTQSLQSINESCGDNSGISLTDTTHKPTTFKRRLIRKAATKYRGANSSISLPEKKGAAGCAKPDMGSIAFDLEKILGEIEIPAEELESLINNLDEDYVDLRTERLFDDSEMDGNFYDAISQLKLDDWTSEDQSSEKYHVEKFKRDQCEKELKLLQEKFLAEKQQNAVLEGTLKRRNLMLMQVTLSFNRVSKEWKKMDSVNKTTIDKLQQDQIILAAACKHSRERISQYEKELHKTLELADSFKSKLVDVQNERDESVLLLKQANNELEEKIAKLKEEMEIMKNERDATLRALRESQIKLDEGKVTLDNMEAHIKSLEDKDSKYVQKYENLLLAKADQESSYMQVMAQQKELETMILSLTTELNLEKSSKDQLKKDLQADAERKSRAEADKLHEYYNKKVQEILKSATEEAARAELALKEQMKRASVESERKLLECRERFQREIDNLKAKYEAEIEKLKRENLHKQLLISSTVKQLQMGESVNLDLNALTMSSRTPYQKETFDILKNNSSFESNPGVGKRSGIGIPHFSKFTLDHLPTVMSSLQQHIGQTKENISHNAFHEDMPFHSGGNTLGRFKTSTPIESHVRLDQLPDNITVDSRKALYGDVPTSIVEKVCNDNQVNSLGTTDSAVSKCVLSHILEAPVKPEIEQPQTNSVTRNGKIVDTHLDPALQKCIHDLLKSYAENRHSHSVCANTDKSGAVCIAETTNSEKEENSVNKIEIDNNANGSEIEMSHCADSTADSISVGIMESRKSKGKLEVNGNSSVGLKPPWK